MGDKPTVHLQQNSARLTCFALLGDTISCRVLRRKYYDKEGIALASVLFRKYILTVVPVCEALTTERWTLSRDLTSQLGLKGQ